MKVCARSALKLQQCISSFRASCMTWSHSERHDLGPGISYPLLSDLVSYSNPNPNPNLACQLTLASLNPKVYTVANLL